MRVLFVCTGNMDRSPTAEDLLKGVEGFEVKSAGTSTLARKRISKEFIDWADVIFAMEDHHQKAILSLSPSAAHKVVVLGVPDRYRRGDPELIAVLRRKLVGHLGMVLREAPSQDGPL